MYFMEDVIASNQVIFTFFQIVYRKMFYHPSDKQFSVFSDSSPDIFGDYLSFLTGCRITVFILSGVDFLGSDK